MKEALRAVPLFEELEDSDLEILARDVTVRRLEAGSFLFGEGDDGEEAFVITEGEIEIVTIVGERQTLLAVRGQNEVIGEMALLSSAPRMASARAASSTEVMVIPKASFDALVATSASAARGLFRVLLARWSETQAMLAQSERMAQLGTLTAGLAHELNNPAAAVSSAAGRLSAAIDAFRQAMERLVVSGEGSVERLKSTLETIEEPRPALVGLERADREAEIEQRLEGVGVDEPWTLASNLAAASVTAEEVASIVASTDQGGGVQVLEAVGAFCRVSSLLSVIEEGSSRLSDIVGALKSYSHLDQAEVQPVDIARGLDDTLLILQTKLKDIEIVRSYAEVAQIRVHAAEINQVWTNLIDNAADAIHEHRTEGGRIEIRVGVEGSDVVVEVEDNGGGIPEEAFERIFDRFFTTKAVGSGTGLGLNISYNIVAYQHRGDMSARNIDGGAVFRVALPIIE